MNRPQAKRMLTLARFIRLNVPKHKLRMETWIIGYSNKLQDTNSNTTGCAAAWLTIIFPEQWIWNNGVPVLKNKNYGVWNSLMKFFGISYKNACDLFTAYSRTPHEQAKILEQFVKSKGFTYQNIKLESINYENS